MKNPLIMLVALIALSGCEDQGEKFIGTWVESEKISNTQTMTETIVVTKASNGYRVTSNTKPDIWGELEVHLVAESGTLLIEEGTKNKKLELSSDNELISYLRNKPKSLARAN